LAGKCILEDMNGLLGGTELHGQRARKRTSIDTAFGSFFGGTTLTSRVDGVLNVQLQYQLMATNRCMGRVTHERLSSIFS